MINPLGNCLVVKPKPRETERASGLLVPWSSDERAQEGELLAVGPKVKSSHLKVGRTIYFGKFSTDGIRSDETSSGDFLCLREVDVLAVVVSGKVCPLGRMMVKMIPIQDDYRRDLGPTLKTMGIQIEDQKKHWEYAHRRGVVEAIDPFLHTEVQEGDVVVFNGAAGFTLDGDVMDEDDKYDAPLKGESWRWLKPKEIDAIELDPIEEVSRLVPS